MENKSIRQELLGNEVFQNIANTPFLNFSVFNPKKVNKMKDKTKEKEENSFIWSELDIWIKNSDLAKFCLELARLNDVKIYETIVINNDGLESRYSIIYKDFSYKQRNGEEVEFPDVEFQLKNHFIDTMEAL